MLEKFPLKMLTKYKSWTAESRSNIKHASANFQTTISSTERLMYFTGTTMQGCGMSAVFYHSLTGRLSIAVYFCSYSITSGHLPARVIINWEHLRVVTDLEFRDFITECHFYLLQLYNSLSVSVAHHLSYRLWNITTPNIQT